MKSRFPHISFILMAAALLALGSCGNDEAVNSALEDFRLDIVTYKAYSESSALFQYVDRDGSVTELVANGIAEPEIKRDHRVLMRYKVTNEKHDRAQIAVYGITGIISDSLRVNSSPIAQYDMHRIRLRSIWQTGEFINVRCQVEYTGKARSFYLLMDADTAGDEVVDCYLVHNLLDKEPLHWRDCYASFNVAALIKRMSCKAIRVHLTDVVRPDVEEYIFYK